MQRMVGLACAIRDEDTERWRRDLPAYLTPGSQLVRKAVSRALTTPTLRELFRRFGAIQRIYLAKDRETHQSRGFAFINFFARDDAQRADVEALIRPEIPAEVKIVGAQGGKLDIALLLGLNRASEDTIHLRPDHHGSADDPDHADHHHDEFDSVVVELGEVDRARAIY